MIPFHAVVIGKGLDAAARREVAALARQMTAEQQHEGQQAVRDVAQEARVAAQQARDAAQSARDGVRPQLAVRAVAQAPEAPPPPNVPSPAPRVTKGTDGRMTIVGPDGSTTILEPDGRYTVVNAKGEVSQSTRGLSSEPDGLPPGAAVSLALFNGFVFLLIGRWWAGRTYRRRAAQGTGSAISAELGDRMQRIEQAVEAVAIEVERVSEGQRFTTKLLSEMRVPSALALGERRP